VADLIHARLSIPVEEVEETELITGQEQIPPIAQNDEDDPIVPDAVEEAELNRRYRPRRF
jgi:hypothetical protein